MGAPRPAHVRRSRFGSIRAWPDGRLDTSRVEGVDADLRVRPFFAQGGAFSLREFTIGAFKDEIGLEATDAVLCAATDPQTPVRVASVGGMVFDPAEDLMVRLALCDPGIDGDSDGVVNEIDPARAATCRT